MSNIAIKAENLSKAYQLGQIGTGTISRDLERWWARVRGKEDPFLKIGETNDRSTKGTSDVVWSLKDINFEIEQGDAVGIIGRNGAGKSTLLKVLSRVTSPTTGSVKLKGRVASLLEVGTGFHPELSGRENIFLNGAILGMRKKEIARKLDEIVDFAGVERYLDTPVKRYSSGMYVRLAFAVAAHLESEILIVDEVLAVGDAEFQKKCLGKMGEVSKGEGRTVLFVSHNMSSIRNLCEKSILLSEGNIIYMGKSSETVLKYYDSIRNKKAVSLNSFIGTLKEKLLFKEININSKNFSGSDIDPEVEIHISISYECLEPIDSFRMTLSIFNEEVRIFSLHNHSSSQSLKRGLYEDIFKIPSFFLRPGKYSIAIGGNDDTFISKGNQWIWGKDLITFNISENYSENYDQGNIGLINLNNKFLENALF